MNSFKPGIAQIKNVYITTRNRGTVDIYPQVKSINVYEDITKPYLYAEIYMNDSIGLLDGLPIVGEEVIKFSVTTMGLSSFMDLTFVVYQVASGQQGDVGKNAQYVLKCVSKEMMDNVSVRVSKAYNDTISNMVSDILRNYCGCQKPITIEATKGTQEIIIPNLHPYQAIDFLRRRAVSNENTSSSYVFFENQYGVFFCTMEKLIQSGVVGSRVFRWMPTAGVSADQSQAFRSIIEYTQASRFQAVDKLNKGVAQNTLAFDFLTGSIIPTNYNSQQGGMTFMGGVPTNSAAFYQTAGITKSITPTPTLVPKDTSKPETYIEYMLNAREVYTTQVSQNKTNILVYGDCGLKVGDMITLALPDPMASSKTTSSLVSGNYMVAKVRHMFEKEGELMHKMSLETIKGDFNKSAGTVYA